MKLLAVIKLAHQTIAKSQGFFLINALVTAGLLALGFGLFYFSMASRPSLVIFLVYPLLALLFYMYVAAAQRQYYGPRLRGEEPFPTVKEACSAAKKPWPSLAILAVVLVAIAAFFLNLPALWSALYTKINPLRSPVILTFEQLKNTPLGQLTQPRNLVFLIFYLASFLLVFLGLPLFALGFTALGGGEGFKTAFRQLRAYFKAKPCSSVLLYLFSMVIMVLFPLRLVSLQGPTSIPVLDVVFLGLQLLIALLVAVYGVLMALVSQMILQEMAATEKK